MMPPQPAPMQPDWKVANLVAFQVDPGPRPDFAMLIFQLVECRAEIRGGILFKPGEVPDLRQMQELLWSPSKAWISLNKKNVMNFEWSKGFFKHEFPHPGG